MKTSYTKRALAFWLAVAMVATSAPMAFAREPDSVPPASTTLEGDSAGLIEIAKQSLELAAIELEFNSHTYTGAEIKPKVTKVTVGGKTLIETDDYTVSYSDNVNAGTAKVTITGAGNYTGKKEKTFTINKADLTIQPAKQSVPIATGVDKVLETLQSTAVKGVGNETVTGTFTITAVESKGALPEKAALNGEITKDNFTQSSGKYEVTASFKPESTNYNEKNDIKFECDVTGKEEQTLTFDAPSIDKTYGEGVFTNLAKSDHDNAGVIKYSSSNEDVATVDADTGAVTVVGVGTTTIKAHTDGTATYLPDDASYELTVKAKDVSGATIEEIEAQTYTGNELKPKLVVKDGGTTLNEGTDYDVVYTDNVFPGTATATVTFKGNYTGTAKKTFQIQKATYSNTTISQSVVAGQNAVLTIPVDLANAEITNYSSITVDGTDASIVDGTPTRNENAITAKIKSSATNNQTANIKIKLTTKGYGEVELTYILTVADSKTQLTSSQINFASKTVTADGKTYFALENASLNGVQDTNGKWTYALQGISTYSTDDQGKMPQFKEPGRYTIVASYQGDSYVGSKTATLTIKPATTSIISLYDVSQISSSRDDNYRYFDVDMGTPRDNYVRVNVDADDDLDKQRVDGTSSEWIGLVLEPTQDGTKKTSGLYVSDDKKEWTSLRDDIRMGDFYIDDVDSTSFELWYDTDDRDCSKSLYLATDTNGSNLFEIDVDFDSFSGSSSSSSGSSSSDTSKKDGDRVSTTTIDKTPSVKSRSATVTFSSSAMSDALDENKREARHEDADVTYIELDARTSKTVDDTTITVPRKSLDKLADEDTGLKLTTNQGTVTFDYRALAEIYDACDKTNIEFYLEEEDDDQYVLLIKDGSSDVIDLGRGSVEVTFDYKLKSGEKSSDVKVYRIGNGDKIWLSTYGGSTVYGAADVYAAAPTYVTDMKADYSSSKKEATFTTDTLGTFLVTTDTLKTGSDSSTTTTPPTTPSYSRFVDVPSSRWSATYINKLASLGIINGTGGGYFEPTLQVTREEFVKMLAGVAGANVTGYTSSRFPDVPMSRWSASYIAWAADRGITTGTDGGRFAPTMKITREEMATMIYRYVQISGKTLPAKNAPVTFADADQISSWAQTAVSVMQQAGIIDGNVTNGRYTFDPQVPASREECAKMLSILYDLL